MEPALHVRGLTKSYGKVHALRGMDLDVQQGELFGFLGPNGAGKTTFTKCVTGFVRPDAGTVRLCGVDSVRNPAAAGRHVGLVPDQYDFYTHMTGRQHLDFYGRLFGMDAPLRARRIDRVLELVGMSDRADRAVKGYSHGMKQRICIGQAIMHKPKLVILDEPTNGLDPEGAHSLRKVMIKMAKMGITIFLNSHQLNEVEQVCKRVAIVHNGKIRIVDEVDNLRARFAGDDKTTLRLLNPTKLRLMAASKALGQQIEMPGPNEYQFIASDEQTASVVDALVRSGGRVVQVEREKATLEDVFLKVTEGQ